MTLPTPPCTPTRSGPGGSAAATASSPRIVHAYQEWQQTAGDEERPRGSWPARTHSFAAEAEQYRPAAAWSWRAGLRTLLVPRDANDGKDVILEVKAGEGGEESALFAGDLLRMYLRYAERQGWKTEVLDATMTGLGGYKDATVAVKSRRAPGRRRRVVPAEVRRRRAPGPAGPGHRVPGPHPHLGRRACWCCRRPTRST